MAILTMKFTFYLLIYIHMNNIFNKAYETCNFFILEVLCELSLGIFLVVSTICSILNNVHIVRNLCAIFMFIFLCL